MSLSRRGLLGAIICAPAIVRAASLMPIKSVTFTDPWIPDHPIPGALYATGTPIIDGAIMQIGCHLFRLKEAAMLGTPRGRLFTMEQLGRA